MPAAFPAPRQFKASLADHGFSCHEDYHFVIKQIYRKNRYINTLNLCGDSGRKKTAFAHALGQVLPFSHVLYHDFSQKTEPHPPVTLPKPKDKSLPRERPVAALDRIVSDACAFSEAEKTLLIFDQLHHADYRHIVRIDRLLRRFQWRYPKNCFVANRDNLVVILISETALYHALQQISFRVWIGQHSSTASFPDAATLQWDTRVQPLLDTLQELFKKLETIPSEQALCHILEDIEQHFIHTESELVHALYGWTETLERESLEQKELKPLFTAILSQIDHYLGIDQLEI